MTKKDNGKDSIGTYSFQEDTTSYSFEFHGDLIILLFEVMAFVYDIIILKYIEIIFTISN